MFHCPVWMSFHPPEMSQCTDTTESTLHHLNKVRCETCGGQISSCCYCFIKNQHNIPDTEWSKKLSEQKLSVHYRNTFLTRPDNKRSQSLSEYLTSGVAANCPIPVATLLSLFATCGFAAELSRLADTEL